MKLYYAPGTCSLAAWITLEWAGADYEVEKVELGSDEYKKINPIGAVPSIETDDGEIRTQLAAIIQYIANKYPEAKLGPDESPEDILEYQEIISLLSSDVHKAFAPIFGPGGFTTATDEEAHDAVKEAAYKNIDSFMKYLDSMIEGKDYFYHDRKTAIDAMAYIFVGWTEATPKAWKEYPNLKKFMENMNEDPAVQKVMEESNK